MSARLSKRRIHVVGCPRSGTTLLMELLWQSYSFGGRCEHERSLFDNPVPPVDRYLSKKPSDTYRLTEVLAADPSLFVIAMQRDPRAVLCSRHPRRPGEYYCDFPRWQRHQAAIDELSAHPRWHTVRYEQLVRDPDAVQAQLGAALPVLGPSRGRFSAYPEGEHVSPAARAALNGVRPFDTTRLDAWHGHLPRVVQQLTAHPELQSALERLGYCEGTTWQQALANVPAEPAPRQPTNWLKHWETEFRFWRRTRRYLRQRAD